MPELSKDDTVKAEILRAAERVFQKWGFNKTTIEDIAHEAGKGKSTLYYYYVSKEEIFEILARNEMNSISERAKEAVSKIDSYKEKLKKYIGISLTEVKKTAGAFPVIKGEMKANKEFIDKLRKQLDQKDEEIVMEILKGGFEQGEFKYLKKSELRKAANVIVGMVRGLEIYLFLEVDDSEKLDIAAKLIAEGL